MSQHPRQTASTGNLFILQEASLLRVSSREPFWLRFCGWSPVMDIRHGSSPLDFDKYYTLLYRTGAETCMINPFSRFHPPLKKTVALNFLDILVGLDRG